jgi:hypothetical protein
VFNGIKELLTTTPVLAYPNFDKAFTLDPDGCDGSIGAVLSQYDNHEVKHSVVFYSRILTPHKARYHTTQKECLAIIEEMKHFWPYLWGRTFTVQTDHSALQWLYKAKNSNDRLYRWFLKLVHDGYNYTVIHRPGKNHGNADGMSQLMCTWDKCNDQHDETIVYTIAPENIPTLPVTTTSMLQKKKMLIAKKAVKLVYKAQLQHSNRLQKKYSGDVLPLTTVDQLASTAANQPDSIKTGEQASAALNNLCETQDKCRVTHELLKWKSTGNVPKDKAMRRIILVEGRNLVVIDGILCRIAPPHTSAKRVPRIQTVVPISM